VQVKRLPDVAEEAPDAAVGTGGETGAAEHDRDKADH
jgi:hypothetical protein